MPVPIGSARAIVNIVGEPGFAAPADATVARLENQFADLLAQHVALKSLVLDTPERTEQYEQLLERARATISNARANQDATLIERAAHSLPEIPEHA